MGGTCSVARTLDRRQIYLHYNRHPHAPPLCLYLGGRKVGRRMVSHTDPRSMVRTRVPRHTRLSIVTHVRALARRGLEEERMPQWPITDAMK